MKVRTRWLIAVGAVLAGLPLAEIALRLFGPTYEPSEARQRTEQLIAHLAGETDGEHVEERHAPGEREINPYFGYDDRDGHRLIERFIALESSPDREGKFVIYVCGGSVPEIFVGPQLGAAPYLAELLEADPKLGGRQVRTCRLARAGYKQPQQIEKLVYLLTRGGRPDAVVNIDGYNEVRLGTNNPKFGVHPTWPSARHWLHLAEGPLQSPGAMEAYLVAIASKEQLLAQARASLESGIYGSAILGLWTERKLAHELSRWSARQDAYVAILAKERPPEYGEREYAETLRLCVQMWSESSRLMHEICREREILYLHLLQPTLHDEGSKKISAEEWRNGVGKEGLLPSIKHSYDRLREAGLQLAGDGVPFVDTSKIFAAHEETLYYDNSHFGKEGNRILAEHIAAELLRRL